MRARRPTPARVRGAALNALQLLDVDESALLISMCAALPNRVLNTRRRRTAAAAANRAPRARLEGDANELRTHDTKAEVVVSTCHAAACAQRRRRKQHKAARGGGGGLKGGDTPRAHNKPSRGYRGCRLLPGGLCCV